MCHAIQIGPYTTDTPLREWNYMHMHMYMSLNGMYNYWLLPDHTHTNLWSSYDIILIPKFLKRGREE